MAFIIMLAVLIPLAIVLRRLSLSGTSENRFVVEGIAKNLAAKAVIRRELGFRVDSVTLNSKIVTDPWNDDIGSVKWDEPVVTTDNIHDVLHAYVAPSLISPLPGTNFHPNEEAGEYRHPSDNHDADMGQNVLHDYMTVIGGDEEIFAEFQADDDKEMVKLQKRFKSLRPVVNVIAKELVESPGKPLSFEVIETILARFGEDVFGPDIVDEIYDSISKKIWKQNSFPAAFEYAKKSVKRTGQPINLSNIRIVYIDELTSTYHSELVTFINDNFEE